MLNQYRLCKKKGLETLQAELKHEEAQILKITITKADRLQEIQQMMVFFLNDSSLQAWKLQCKALNFTEKKYEMVLNSFLQCQQLESSAVPVQEEGSSFK